MRMMKNIHNKVINNSFNKKKIEITHFNNIMIHKLKKKNYKNNNS
jgi:hypothetical protein